MANLEMHYRIDTKKHARLVARHLPEAAAHWVRWPRPQQHPPNTEMIRDHFPALKTVTYLNTAGGAPIPDVAHAAASRYYQESLDDGDVHWNTWLDRTDQAREAVGALIGCAPRNVAFLGNASAGLNLAAELDEPGRFAHAESEFPSCTLPWLRRGFEPVRWSVAEDGSFDADDVAPVIGDASVLVLSWVQFATGFRADLAAMSEICRASGTRLVVDATQAIAAFPLDATGLGLDVVVFSGYKWLTSGYGVAGVAFPKGLPPAGSPHAGWRSQLNPFELRSDQLNPGSEGQFAESGHPPFPNVFSMGAAARLWGEHGPAQTEEAILGLVAHLHGQLDRLGVNVLSGTQRASQSGIVLIQVDDPPGVAESLRLAGILTSARRAGLRVSVHAYNTVEEVDRLAFELGRILGR